MATSIVRGKGCLPTTFRENTYILTMIDCFTCFVIAEPLPDESSKSVIHAIIYHYITFYGTPRRVHSDQATDFESKIYDYFFKLFVLIKSEN